MRIGARRLSAVIAGLLVVVAVVAATITYVRWRAAGVAHPIAPPAGAVVPDFAGPGYQEDVSVRSLLVARSLRNDRGKATVRIYEMPPGSPWLRSRQTVATQLDHWEQIGDCADNPEATLVECAWREPTRWWPREVALTMVRPRPAKPGQADRIFVIIGSGLGD
ncbi:hypothetical protein GCM10010172_63590 [Paractinoplanes ferrugineus]|uniref:Uncharacterized protein n=1 Tax=Paractinoplanes ferrugineus TaxID=113564 RepID=A0A919JBV2_9ACTN|nr:hypothetical protein [Actinoplanes ferrugineus]GIE16449.1 hypothetical protein Afe05nite_82890 [Actinoplanes ferrugineus]